MSKIKHNPFISPNTSLNGVQPKSRSGSPVNRHAAANMQSLGAMQKRQRVIPPPVYRPEKKTSLTNVGTVQRSLNPALAVHWPAAVLISPTPSPAQRKSHPISPPVYRPVKAAAAPVAVNGRLRLGPPAYRPAVAMVTTIEPVQRNQNQSLIAPPIYRPVTSSSLVTLGVVQQRVNLSDPTSHTAAALMWGSMSAVQRNPINVKPMNTGVIQRITTDPPEFREVAEGEDVKEFTGDPGKLVLGLCKYLQSQGEVGLESSGKNLYVWDMDWAAKYPNDDFRARFHLHLIYDDGQKDWAVVFTSSSEGSSKAAKDHPGGFSDPEHRQFWLINIKNGNKFIDAATGPGDKSRLADLIILAGQLNQLVWGAMREWR